jgi:hypothetical protein
MSSVNILWPTIRTFSVFTVAGSQSTTRFHNTNPEESFAISVRAGAAIVTSSRTAASRVLSNRGGSYSSVAAQRSPAVRGITISPLPLERAKVDEPNPPAKAASTEDPAKPVSRNERLHLTIDSLPNYDLMKPIAVVVDSLADKIFTAEAPDLNLSMAGNSLGDALVLLKERITTIYEEYRMKKTLDPDQTRRFQTIQTYIGRTKRGWRL